jgi:tetratricopeptide (TPR) repeat protein
MKAKDYFLVVQILAWSATSLNAQQGSQSPVLRKADSLFFHLDYKDALEQYMDDVKTNTNPLPVTSARMAFSNHFLGNYQQALTLYNEVLQKQIGRPLRAQLYSRMAMTYSMKGNKQAALVFLDSAVANGYLNTYELDSYKDFKAIRNDEKFKSIYNRAYINAFPCKSIPGARLFDFWIGEWDVYNNLFPNNRVGTSIIQNVSGECTILENWQSYNNPFSGKSQNWYDTTTKKWTQLWIGSGGGHQYFTDGEYKDGAMRFKFQQPDANGVMQPGNFIFYNLGPDKVRQYNEVSNDNGKTFQVVYDFIYIRKK